MLKKDGYKVVEEFNNWAERVFGESSVQAHMRNGLFLASSFHLRYENASQYVNYEKFMPPKDLLSRMKKDSLDLTLNSSKFPRINNYNLSEEDKSLIRNYLDKEEDELDGINSELEAIQDEKADLEKKILFLQKALGATDVKYQ